MIGANLVNNPQTLPEFLDTAHVTVVAVAVLSDGDVELDLFVHVSSQCVYPWGFFSEFPPHRICRKEQPFSDPT
jgi:hypothetical protein